MVYPNFNKGIVKILFNHPSIFPSLNLVFSEKFMMFLSKEKKFLLSVNVVGSTINFAGHLIY